MIIVSGYLMKHIKSNETYSVSNLTIQVYFVLNFLYYSQRAN